jgi:hypothetical protein
MIGCFAYEAGAALFNVLEAALNYGMVPCLLLREVDKTDHRRLLVACCK